MKVHSSHYEEDLGWVPLRKNRPEPKVKVLLARIRLLDWNIEMMEWETEGWYCGDRFGNYRVKKVEGLSLDNSKPTHYKPL